MHTQKNAHHRLTVLQKILAGDRKWKGPIVGFVFILFLLNWAYFTLFLVTKIPVYNRVSAEQYKIASRKEFTSSNSNIFSLHDPEIKISSQRTTTIFFPNKSCLATTDANLPRRCPLPSITTVSGIIYILQRNWCVASTTTGFPHILRGK